MSLLTIMNNRVKINLNLQTFASLITVGTTKTALTNDLIIDDRTSEDLGSNMGNQWRLITDQVMGGISNGTIVPDSFKDRNCLRMRGNVSTENNGGFVQMSLSLNKQWNFDASAYDGVELDIAGNNEAYNTHFRTSGLWLPWQSYRASFKAADNWQTIRIPFENLEAYRITQKFSVDKITRIGLVGLGRDFQADLCMGSLKFYSSN